MYLGGMLVRIQTRRTRVPPRPEPEVAGFDPIDTPCVEWVDVFGVLYDTNTVEKDDVQRALGTEDGWQGASALQTRLGLLYLRSASSYGICAAGRFLITTGNEYVIAMELNCC